MRIVLSPEEVEIITNALSEKHRVLCIFASHEKDTTLKVAYDKKINKIGKLLHKIANWEG